MAWLNLAKYMVTINYCLKKAFGILEVTGDFRQFETPLRYETHRNFSLYYAQN